MIDLTNKTCLVTGGLGFIGSNLVRTLGAAGAQVRVLDALVETHGGDQRNIDLNENIGVTIGDIADEHLVEAILKDVDFIFNVAGQVSHHESMIDPLRDAAINVIAQLKFLESVRRNRPTAKIVHTSTRQVYGAPQYLPVDEKHPTIPRDINGVNKLAGENYHRLYGTVHGLYTACLRLTNVFGPRQSLMKQGLGFMPVFLARSLRGQTIDVFGDGQQQRDCLYVSDVVDALIAAAVGLESQAIPSGEVINLGHSETLTLLQIAQIVAAGGDSGSRVELTSWPDELVRIDIGGFIGEYAKAHQLLDWHPKVSFTDGVDRTLNFYREHPWYLT